MKSILENRPELARRVAEVAEVAGYLWQKGWAERNGGNITVNVTAYADDAVRSMAPISDPVPFGMTLPHLKGCYFFCKGTNRRMRDLARRPMENGSVIRILDDCASYEIIADNPVKPTSELASHLAMQDRMIATGNGYTAAVHTHPIDLIAMTHNPAFLAKDVLTNLLWSMIPETRAFCPKGLGIVPYKMPSSTELAEATKKPAGGATSSFTEEQLRAAIENYNKIVKDQYDPDFHKGNLKGYIDLEYIESHDDVGICISPRKASLHHTTGGVKINTEAEVIGTNGKAISGLWAAGEVTGGIHAGNRLGGNAEADVFTFGKIAGHSAAAAE
ncbi:rhamnulose-1-phosphate aldolase [uncultured Alistipes sp.]|uniref:rhamnulose-1-phosphate aldolase n=1 Tax=uncultured Alistipes sp. TaxID=538949 RepID=UPI0032202F32